MGDVHDGRKKSDDDSAEEKKRRQIPGELTYTSSPGVLKNILASIIRAEQPDRFSQDFLQTVLQVKGGSANAQIPILKRLGFLRTDGAPTEIYAGFRSDAGRPRAAFDALRNGYANLFQRNAYVYRVPLEEVRDLSVQVTGLRKDDAVIGYIASTFDAVRSHIPGNFVPSGALTKIEPESSEGVNSQQSHSSTVPQGIGLAYNINIVLPSSNNIETYNLIFRSLRENILDWQK